MAFNILNLVFGIDPAVLPASMKLVALRLADRAHKDGSEARPSVGSMAHELGVSKRQVQMSLRRMQEIGIITVDRFEVPTLSKPRSYRFDLSRLAEIQQRPYHHRFEADKAVGPRPDEDGAAPTRNACGGPPHGMHRGSALGAPKPSNKPLTKSHFEPTHEGLLRDLGKLKNDIEGGRIHSNSVYARWNVLWQRADQAPYVRKLLNDLLVAFDELHQK